MTEAIIIVTVVFGLAAAVGFALLKSPAIPDFKSVNAEMNDNEALRHQLRIADALASKYRFALIQIETAFDGQQLNGQAKIAVRLAKQGLEG